MEAFLASTLLVGFGEIGDKTQLLALMLGARFGRPGAIVLGILAATLLNHTIAALGGAWIGEAIDAATLRWALGLSFIAMAAWTLKPDRLAMASDFVTKYGIFAVTFTTFFFAEIGDKTQLATVALAARYTDLTAVVAGTTTGMLVADVPIVFLGERASLKIPFSYVRYVAAALFAAMGIMALASVPVLDLAGR